MSIYIIIGKNFGDEGKGLATDYFAARSQESSSPCIVVRHNGGGQAGHTVDLPQKRFVFHQLSSGSFRDADTYWAQSFLPDLYKLSDELKEFYELHGKVPKIHAHHLCKCVYIDDVLINMALETSRGSNRHGSCGMGINEAVERSAKSEYCLFLGELCKMSAAELYSHLEQLRKKHVPKRLKELGLSLQDIGEYGELLTDRNVLINAAEQMHYATRFITIADTSVLCNYSDVIFEGAQGLLLDENYLPFAPHLTSSKTGSDNPSSIIKEHFPDTVPELVYVTRSYVTRHGAGPLPYEKLWDQSLFPVCDPTNIPNEWQGALRMAPHGTPEEFFSDIFADAKKNDMSHTVSCMLTHLNESDNKLISCQGFVDVADWFGNPTAQCIEKLYLSGTPYSQDIKISDKRT